MLLFLKISDYDYDWKVAYMSRTIASDHAIEKKHFT